MMYSRGKIKYLSTTAVIGILAIGFVTAPAFAAPHFIGTPQITKNPNFSLGASFSAAGFANIPTYSFLSSSGGTAFLQCVSQNGHIGKAKPFSFGPLVGPSVAIQPRNGQITASVSIGPPTLPSAADFCHNPNRTIVISSITYNNVVLHIQQNNVDILTWNFGTVDP